MNIKKLSKEDLIKALQIIKGWSKCQCDKDHGDNLNCPVLIAENALKGLDLRTGNKKG